jgi:predicted SnoaL-like aldol condensation-catalyzing enzyme
MPVPYVEYGNTDKEAAMTPEQDNKATVGRLYQAFRAGDVAKLDDLLASDFINHNPQTTNGLEASKALFAQVGAIDADLHRMVAQGDLVAVHAHYKTPAETAGMDFFKLRDGKIVEHWDVIQDLPEHTASGQDMFSELS